MRNASLHCLHAGARRSSLLLLLPFALATAQAQSAPEAEPVAAPAAVEQVAASVGEEAARAPESGAAESVPDQAAVDASGGHAERSATSDDAPGATAPGTVAAAPPVATAPAPRPLVVPLLSNEDNAIERQMGARCPNDLAARLATQGHLLIGACQGPMPAHLANVLRAIPEQQLLLPRAARERQLSQKAWFKAVPGYGQRPDFLAVQNDLWVRSFEGADAATTVYLVSGPFTCVDGRYPDPEAGKTVRLSTGGCREALVQQRVYQVTAGGAPQDITAQVMPAQPLLSDADQRCYGIPSGGVQLDPGKLQFGPVLRWYADVSTEGKAEPRTYGEWGRLHLGFLVWNGERFEPRDTVPRTLWACDPVAPGDAACSGYADAGRDPFVVNTAAVAGQSATP